MATVLLFYNMRHGEVVVEYYDANGRHARSEKYDGIRQITVDSTVSTSRGLDGSLALYVLEGNIEIRRKASILAVVSHDKSAHREE